MTTGVGEFTLTSIQHQKTPTGFQVATRMQKWHTWLVQKHIVDQHPEGRVAVRTTDRPTWIESIGK